MRFATVEQLAEVPGFGGKAAAELKVFLEARSASRPGRNEGESDPVPPEQEGLPELVLVDPEAPEPEGIADDDEIGEPHGGGA